MARNQQYACRMQASALGLPIMRGMETGCDGIDQSDLSLLMKLK